MKTYMVYYMDSDGFREGAEIIRATSKEEAISTYRDLFNVREEWVNAVIRYSPMEETYD